MWPGASTERHGLYNVVFTMFLSLRLLCGKWIEGTRVDERRSAVNKDRLKEGGKENGEKVRDSVCTCMCECACVCVCSTIVLAQWRVFNSATSSHLGLELVFHHSGTDENFSSG